MMQSRFANNLLSETADNFTLQQIKAYICNYNMGIYIFKKNKFEEKTISYQLKALINVSNDSCESHWDMPLIRLSDNTT